LPVAQAALSLPLFSFKGKFLNDLATNWFGRLFVFPLNLSMEMIFVGNGRTIKNVIAIGGISDMEIHLRRDDEKIQTFISDCASLSDGGEMFKEAQMRLLLFALLLPLSQQVNHFWSNLLII
jgi:hypothetical protein